MPRLSHYKKGQWFLISAVILSGAFLFMASLFRSYSSIDISQTERDENFYFMNIKNDINKIITGERCSEDALKEFGALARSEMNSLGIFLYLNYTYDCDAGTSEIGILLASDKAVLYENINPNDVISGIV